MIRTKVIDFDSGIISQQMMLHRKYASYARFVRGQFKEYCYQEVKLYI